MLTFAISLAVISSAWFAYEIYTAPYGYEDEHGFHYGFPPVIDIK